MSDLDPTEATTTDLDPTTVTPVHTSVVSAPPVTPVQPGQPAGAVSAIAADGPTNPVEQPVEPGVTWAAAVPVQASSQGGSGRGRRLRWAAAIAVIVLVLGSSAALAAFISGAAGRSTVIGYVPADSVAYAEARLDLPGDQRKAVGEFLAHFPGFKDSAALDTKLDEALDQFVKDATNDKQTYTTDIKPWFGGELAFSIGPLPPAGDFSNGGDAAARQARALGLLSVTDPAGAQAYFDKLAAQTGEEITKQTYNGTQLTVYAAKDGPSLAYAVVGGRVVAIGDLASVKAAVDSNGKSGFVDEPGPKAALGAADQDHVGFVYVALRPLMDWSSGLSKATAGSGGVALEPISDALLKTIPEWASYWLRVEQNSLVMEAAAPKPEVTIFSTESRTSALVKRVPSSAMVMSVSNSLGQTLGQTIDFLQTQPAYKELVDQLNQALGVVGGRDAALGWIGDTAIVVNDAGGTPEGGLLVIPTDASKAKALFTSISTLIGIGGSQQGITVRTEDYNGTTITVVDLGDLSRQLGVSGAGNQIGGVPIPAGAHLEIAYAVTDDLVVIGTGPGFVKHVLDTNDASSLANDPQYKDLAGRVGAGTGQSFVDITAIRLMLEKAAAASGSGSLSRYESDIKPFLEPFDAMFASGTYQGDLGRSTVIVSVK